MLKNRLYLFSLAAFFLFIPTASVFSQAPKKIKTIVVDAGHGGKDGGAVGQYENSLRSKEKDITLEISKKLVAELNRRLPDVNVVPTRTVDIFQTPNEKAKIANDAKGDLFLWDPLESTCRHASLSIL